MPDRWFWVVLGVLGCSPVRRIPTPSIPSSDAPPAMARAHYLRGQVLLHRGDVDGAMGSLQAAHVFDPDEPTIITAMGRVALTQGQIDEARGHFTAATTTDPAFAEAWYALGQLEQAFGEPAAARLAYRHTVELNSRWEARANLIALLLRDEASKDALPLLDAWGQLPTTDAHELGRRAILRSAANDPAGATDDYLEVIRFGGPGEQVAHALIRNAIAGKRVAHAILRLEGLLSISPERPAGWLALGMLCDLIGDHGAAERALQRAETMGMVLPAARPEEPSPGQSVPAASSMPPTSSMSSVRKDPLATAIELARKGHFDDAKEIIVSALENQLNDSSLRFVLAQVVFEQEGWMAAESIVEELLADDPSHAAAQNLWAYMQAEHDGDLVRAEGSSRAALEEQPLNADFWDTLGWILYRAGRHGEALRVLDRAVRMAPDDGAIRSHRDRVQIECQEDGK